MKLRAALGLAFAVLASACVTEQPGNGRLQSPPDLAEAARINTQLGVDYARQGRLDVAEEKLGRAVDQDPNYAIAHSSLAYVLGLRGNVDDAEREYRRALAADPNDSSVHNNFGVLLCSIGKTADADREFNVALRDRNYATPEAAWTNAGVCARKAGDRARAEESFRQALRIKPDFLDALAGISAVAYERQEWLRVRAFVQRYERLHALPVESLYIAADTERKLGDAAAAKNYEINLLREYPESDQAAQILRRSSAP